jgi:hypothetical protein
VPGTSDPVGGMPDWKSPFRSAAQTSMDEYAAVRDQLGINSIYWKAATSFRYRFAYLYPRFVRS